MESREALSAEIRKTLDAFVAAAEEAFGDDLVSVVLYGSAAEARLRATSDVNVLLLLRKFEKAGADAFRDALRTAHAAIRLEVMFLLDSEIAAASDAFAVKFSDILSRRLVLRGTDPFTGILIPRSATIQRLKQVLVNLSLRLRERYVMVSLREEQLAHVAADFSGPLRAAAATLLRMESGNTVPPKEALQQVVRDLSLPNGELLLIRISEARERGVLPAGVGPALLFDLMAVVRKMHERAGNLR